MNPSDPTVADESAWSTRIAGDGTPFDYTIAFDTEEKTVCLTLPGGKTERGTLKGDFPDGLCYLHLQTGEEDDPREGIYVERLSFQG